MADIAKVTGTLDDAELNFSHSVGTVYKPQQALMGSEKDHVAVVTATDSAGNSTTGNNGYFYFRFMDYTKN